MVHIWYICAFYQRYTSFFCDMILSYSRYDLSYRRQWLSYRGYGRILSTLRWGILFYRGLSPYRRQYIVLCAIRRFNSSAIKTKQILSAIKTYLSGYPGRRLSQMISHLKRHQTLGALAVWRCFLVPVNFRIADMSTLRCIRSTIGLCVPPGIL